MTTAQENTRVRLPSWSVLDAHHSEPCSDSAPACSDPEEVGTVAFGYWSGRIFLHRDQIEPPKAAKRFPTVMDDWLLSRPYLSRRLFL